MTRIPIASEPGISADGKSTSDPFLDWRPSLQEVYELLENAKDSVKVAALKTQNDDAFKAFGLILQAKAAIYDLIQAEGK